MNEHPMQDIIDAIADEWPGEIGVVAYHERYPILERLFADGSTLRKWHDAEIAKAVAEAEARMREHYRPLVVWACVDASKWASWHRRAVRRVLGEQGITGPLADECIAAAEAER